MRSLIVCLSLGVVAILAVQCSAQTVEDWPFDTAGRSINILEGEFRIPLFDWTYNEGQTFRSSYNNKTYRVPDSMVALDRSSALYQTYTSNVGNLSEVHNQEKKYSGWAIGLPFLGFGKQKSINTITDVLKDGKHELFMVQKELGVYTVASWTNAMLSQRFLAKLRQLPRQYEAAAYKAFLDYAGTHFFSQGNFGGRINFYVSVHEDIFKSMKKSEVSRQVGAYVSFLCFKIGFTNGMEKSQLDVSETFKKYAKASCEITPGDGYVSDCENLSGYYKDWVDTVLKQPTLLTPRLYPLTELLASAAIPYKAEIKKALDTAIAAYPKYTSQFSAEMKSDGFLSAKRTADSEFQEFLDTQSKKRSLAATEAVIDIVPGARFLGMGYDLVTEEYRALPVVKFNYNASNGLACDYQGCQGLEMSCWRDPLHRDRSYTMPKGVCLTLVGTSETQLGSTAYMSRDAYESYYEHTSKHKSLFGLKRSSSSTHEYMKRFYEEDYALSIAQMWSEKYILSMNAILGLPTRDLPLHPKFIEAVNQLPSVYIPNAYREFIARFGTHFVFDVTLGSSLTSEDWFHRCLSYTYGDKWSSHSSSLNLIVASKKSGHFTESGKLDAKWIEYSKSLIQYEGGSPFAFTPEQYDDWLATTAINPAPISKTLEPIYEVVHRIDSAKGVNIEKALTAYLAEMATQENVAQKYFENLDPKDQPSWCPS